ncbi:MAG TPA: hypothetical protein VFU47_07405, partial [Armatimonadota bacterium]|nr:hypothetical protein [Armatimonadota bacterium]
MTVPRRTVAAPLLWRTVSMLQRLVSRVRKAWTFLSAWVERHPRRALLLALLLVLLPAAWETAYWPLHDYPGVTWHYSPRGYEVERIQAMAARATPPDLLHYWYG